MMIVFWNWFEFCIPFPSLPLPLYLLSIFFLEIFPPRFSWLITRRWCWECILDSKRGTLNPIWSHTIFVCLCCFFPPPPPPVLHLLRVPLTTLYLSLGLGPLICCPYFERVQMSSKCTTVPIPLPFCSALCSLLSPLLLLCVFQFLRYLFTFFHYYYSYSVVSVSVSVSVSTSSPSPHLPYFRFCLLLLSFLKH